MYYVITDNKKETILCTRSFTEGYLFLMKTKDAKIRTMDYNAKPRVIDKRIFITDLWKSSKKEQDDKVMVYNLVNKFVKGQTNKNFFLDQLGLRGEYELHRMLTAKSL